MKHSPGVRLALPAVQQRIPQDFLVVDQADQDPESLEVEVEDQGLVLENQEQMVLGKRWLVVEQENQERVLELEHREAVDALEDQG